MGNDAASLSAAFVDCGFLKQQKGAAMPHPFCVR